MDTRRDFLKKALLLSGAAGLTSAVPSSIQKALAINPRDGSTYLDAEHIVILMQENRSFDHCFGTLRGVRGLNDPRAVKLPNKNLVWLQTNQNGDTYAPFHFGIRETKITWMGSLPHSRSSQIDSFNNGRYDNWLEAKKPGNKKYAEMPLTMGFYNRDDLPFNYALADAFTICDQHFSSAMTSTWPNRLYLWGGTIRGEKDINAKAYIRNNIPWGEATWKTFPERLEDNNISWRVYQNELSNGGGFQGEERSWLDNFGCNPLEQQAQFNSRFSDRYVNTLKDRAATMPGEISKLETTFASMTPNDINYDKRKTEIQKKKEVLENTEAQLMLWSKENFDKLTAYQKSLFDRAFTTNAGDPDYLSLDTLTYEDKGIKHKVPIPKGDVLHQFRKDVDTGNLPAVSWIIPSQKLSDHPSAPWYGTWYTSEILDILTKNPEVWKKTIFILTYDENDGYFDHVVPFIPPLHNDLETGKCSEGIDTSAEYIKLENELAEGIHKKEARGGPIGLGYRVPMIIASPWSRGGKVCSQVLDHTSVIQFLEVFLNKKFQKDIRQTEITAWRRAISGNMTAAFSRYDGREIAHLPFITRDPFIEGIYDAQFTGEPTSYKKLTAQEIEEINKTPLSAKWLPKQEPGIRTACPLPYQLYAHSGLTPDKRNIRLSLKASDAAFGKDAAGAPFNVYAANRYAANPDRPDIKEPGRIWHFAVKAGDTVSYQWPVQNFEGNQYDLEVHGPNGFYRRIAGSQDEMPLEVICEYQRDAASRSRLTGNIDLKISNKSKTNRAEIRITDNRYGREPLLKTIAPGKTESILINLKKSHNWYDFSVILPGFKSFIRQYAGRVETGDETRSDPYMGSVKV